MKFNTSTARRKSFGADAEVYAKGRLPVPPEVVDKILADLGVDCLGVVEVGAGTGQLTGPLLARGLTVWAVEPDPRLSEILLRGTSLLSLEVLNSDFEDVAVDEFRSTPGRRGIVAANAFHWLDCLRALDRAAVLLEADERLVLYWSYPMWRSPPAQLAFNASLAADLADLRRDPDTHWADVERSAAEGREQVLSHGAFAIRSWGFSVTQEERTVEEMADLWASFGSSAGLRPAVLDAVRRTVAVAGTDQVATRTLHYIACYARG